MIRGVCLCLGLGLASLMFAACSSPDAGKGYNSAAFAKNDSFEPGKILLDENGRVVNAHGAGFIFDNGRYYMFGEHKLGGDLGNRAMVGVHCYSSADLYNWRDEGIALEMSTDKNSPILRGTILERPKVVFNEKTKKYVMVFHLEGRKGETAKSIEIEDILKEKPNYRVAKLGFAVSDSVKGPYKFVRALRPNAGKYPIGWEGKMKAVRTLLNKYPLGRDKKYRFNGGEIRTDRCSFGFPGDRCADLTYCRDDKGVCPLRRRGECDTQSTP